MPNYSITLNFFIPKRIVEVLNEIEISENLSFDWRNIDYCHCTVKAISLSDEVPDKEIFDNWVEETKKTLLSQKPFQVTIGDIDTFPKVIYAHVKSDELIILHKKLFEILPSSQPQFEGDDYTPHISIGIRRDKKTLDATIIKYVGEFEVNEIQLVIWNLKELHRPTIYHTFKLEK